MHTSFKFSGDTELLFSESVSLPADEDEVEIAGTGNCCDWSCCCSAFSTNSLSIWAFRTGVVVVFRRCGFVIGDWRTPAFPLFAAPFLVFLTVSAGVRPSTGVFLDSWSMLLLMSRGELMLAEPSLLSNAAMGSFCACNAGEVRGLK